MASDLADPVRIIAGLFVTEPAHGRPGGLLTPAAHMLQAAALATGAGAGPAMVAATLLHDVGRLTGTARGRTAARRSGYLHCDTGADWLARWFGEEVTGPVRLHVAAKRYLCAAEPGYIGALSGPAALALPAQGGPMTPREMAAFEAHPHAYAALRLRRWDDEAQDPAITAQAFGYYQPLLRRLIQTR